MSDNFFDRNHITIQHYMSLREKFNSLEKIVTDGTRDQLTELSIKMNKEFYKVIRAELVFRKVSVLTELVYNSIMADFNAAIIA